MTNNPFMTGNSEPSLADRPYHVLNDPVVYPVIAMGVALTTALPIFLGQRLCLPLLNGLAIFPLFAWALRVGKPRRAVALGLFWAACQAVATVVASLLLADQAAVTIIDALEYRTDVLSWIASTSGQWHPVGQGLSRQARELAIFAVATLLTAGLGGMVLIASTINMLSFTAASLIQQASRLPVVLLTAWPAWSIIRLLGYLTCGAVLAEPLAVLDLRPRWWAGWWRRRRRLLATGLGIIVLSGGLQIWLAPLWARWLRVATGLSQ